MYIHNFRIDFHTLTRENCVYKESKWVRDVKSEVEAHIAKLNESQNEVNFTPKDPVFFYS